MPGAKEKGSDAAHREAFRTRGVRLDELHGRRGVFDLRRFGDVKVLQLLTGDDGDRDGNLLHVFGALLRGDDDFLDALRRFLCRRYGGGRLRCRGCWRRRRFGGRCGHDSSPERGHGRTRP